MTLWMTAYVAGCKKRPCSALDRAFLFVSQISINHHLVGTPFYGTVGSFQSG